LNRPKVSEDDEDLDAEELLAGIADEDLDEESRAAKRRAQEKKKAQFDAYNKKQTLADVLFKSNENILDHVLEKNMAEAQIFIDLEERELERQSRMLKRSSFSD
jgi:uncharacterized protein with gpF-like domain